MNATVQTIMIERPPPTLIDRVSTLVALAAAIALFQTVGWFAVAPDDPLGAVSMLERSSALGMLIQSAALACVVSGLATIIAGRAMTEVGVFAASIALAITSLRGTTVEHVLLQQIEQGQGFERSLALRFALESIGWFAGLLAAVVTASAVLHYCYPNQVRRSDGGTSADGAIPAGVDLMRFTSKNRSIIRTPVAEGAKHTLLAAGVAIFAMIVLSTGLEMREVRHGQVFFVVAASVWIGTHAACRIAPVRSILWTMLAVALMAVGGYLWAAIRPAGSGSMAGVPGSHFMRVLPIQFISVGVAATVVSFWATSEPIGNNAPPRAPGRRSEKRKP